MRVFFRAHGLGASGLRVPQARFLLDAAAALQQRHLPVDLILQRLGKVAEGVQVLDFGFDAELLRPNGPHADVGVAAQ